MSVILDETGYRTIRNDDPSYQAMTRVSDANNIYDVKQTYIKNSERNDFTGALSDWDNNCGLLNDGKYISMKDFFMTVEPTTVNGKKYLKGITVPYFKFKTNAILDYRGGTRIAGTYIDKTKQESIYSLTSINAVDTSGDVTVVYGQSEKKLEENVYNSYPLQRVDKLVIYDLASLFLYVNGRKIPDNEIFVYTNKSFTDVFIPRKYLGDIENPDITIEDTIAIDYRQAASEELYYRNESFTGNTIDIDLNDEQYDYVASKNKELDINRVVLFVNGYIKRAKSISKDENDILHIELNDSLNTSDVELYILNNIVYRSTPEDTRLLNKNETKLHFYLNNDYTTDVLCGPITKSAVSFFYDSKRIDDDLITQTSRFSFEYNIEIKDFDPTKVDFFIEDINWKISDISYKTYGDDYYLLNMLGVKRCVDKMRGYKSYSVFDESLYSSLSFKKALSNNGELFDVLKARNKYKKLDYQINSPTTRAKSLITERPTLLRKFLEEFQVPCKRLIVLGNDKDVVTSSVSKITDLEAEVYYKIYVNHSLISTSKYSTERDGDHDLITIDKSVLIASDDVDEIKNFKKSVNEIEIYQYDMTYKNKCVYLDTIDNSFDEVIESDGSKSYVKTYLLEDLPFTGEFLIDDICAIEKVAKDWYDSNSKEYYFTYPSSEHYGYRCVKYFEVLKKTDDLMTIKIKLNDYTHTKNKFFLMSKQYNVTEEFVITNEDNSYLSDNDVVKPIYSTYVEKDSDGKVVEIYDFIPYINNSEPIVQQNGKELIYGDKYTFINPLTNDNIACSFLILKQQPSVDDVFTLMFNSNKTNILIVGYDNLNIDNRYGLLYLSELKVPISTQYMNIIVNGEKLSELDVDILSDKLIRVHHVYRPITSVLITTNSLYKDIELQDYMNLYQESEFEKVLESIFHNCDPSKKYDAEYPIIDYVYKVDPYYSDFVGEEEHDYNNEYYKEYVNYIYEHENEFDKNSVWSSVFSEPDSINEPEKHEAWVNANKFFNIYKWNHGFVKDSDSVQQMENPLVGETKVYESDVFMIMYLNWLARSKQTRTYGFKADNIDPIVLKYFSIYQNTIIDNRIDIVVDAGKEYEGLQDDINEIIKYDWDETNPKPIYQYPGGQIDLRRRYFWNMFLTLIEEKQAKNPDNEISYVGVPDTTELDIIENMKSHKLANTLYPCDFPIEPDKNGIRWTGTNVDIVTNYIPEN